MNLFFINIMVLVRKHLQSYLNDEFKTKNIKSSEIFLMQILYRDGDKSQIELARIIECDKSHIHRIVSKLIDKNLIEYSKDYKQSKNLKLTLTSEGKIFSAKIDKVIKTWHTKLLKGINSSDLKTARTVMKQLLHNANNLKEMEYKNA